MRKIIYWIILIGIVGKLIFYIVANKNYFLRRFDPVYFSNLYSQSQYIVGSGSKGIGDDGLYAFAGYYYLFQGGDVTKVNFEHPPLGKYLIGVSILLFHNENVINILYFIFLLLVTYKIGQIILDDNLLSLIAVGLLSFDPLFLDHLIRSQLDLPFTLFSVAAAFFFLKGLQNAKYFYFSFLFWGAAFATRFFPFFVIIYIYLLIVLVIYKRKYLKIFLTASSLVPIIYLVIHATFFIHQPSFIEFLRHKKWMLSWYTGSPVVVGNIWKNILAGIYIDPTGQTNVINRLWTPLMPLIVILAIVRLRKSTVRKNQLSDGIIYWLSILYLIYLTFLTLGLQKMLMPIFPLLVILAVSNLASLYSIITAWRQQMRKSSRGK